jgi:hypothetical protein
MDHVENKHTSTWRRTTIYKGVAKTLSELGISDEVAITVQSAFNRIPLFCRRSEQDRILYRDLNFSSCLEKQGKVLQIARSFLAYSMPL